MEDKDLLDLINLMRSPLPSQNQIEYWLQHYSDNVKYPSHTDKGGKWLVFASKEDIDEVWEKIKIAQDKGDLGNISKVSTARKNKYSNDENHVICIYTYDSEDREDLVRVRNSLRDLGFVKPINYKRDIETIKGIYGSDNEFLLKM